MTAPTQQQFNALLSASADAIDQSRTLAPQVIDASKRMARCLENRGKVLICGNGGSAADSLHFSSELLNKFVRERRPLAAVSLMADVATLTSIGNDESYDAVFSKQVEALGQPQDILVAITTSGNSPSILRAVQAAQDAGMTAVSLNGRDGGKLSGMMAINDIDIVVPLQSTARIQEVHGIIIHAFCQFIDQQLFGELE